MAEFDYNLAIGELEKIEKKVQDPSTPLQEIDKLLKEAAKLIEECRKYLRTARETFTKDL